MLNGTPEAKPRGQELFRESSAARAQVALLTERLTALTADTDATPGAAGVWGSPAAAGDELHPAAPSAPLQLPCDIDRASHYAMTLLQSGVAAGDAGAGKAASDARDIKSESGVSMSPSRAGVCMLGRAMAALRCPQGPARAMAARLWLEGPQAEGYGVWQPTAVAAFVAIVAHAAHTVSGAGCGVRGRGALR